MRSGTSGYRVRRRYAYGTGYRLLDSSTKETKKVLPLVLRDVGVNFGNSPTFASTVPPVTVIGVYKGRTVDERLRETNRKYRLSYRVAVGYRISRMLSRRYSPWTKRTEANFSNVLLP